MKKELTFHTRREFLKRTVLGGAMAWTVPGFIADTFAALQEGNQSITGRDAPVLVVLQMAGGNDGLNTLVPYSNDHYHKARPRLGLRADRILKINDTLGLHGSLGGLKELFDAGHLSIVQGVGYPNPNRSHFRSTEIWQTASDADRFERYGWVGRYFDNACRGCDPTIGVSVGRQSPQAFASKNPKGISLDNPKNYRFIDPEMAEGAAEAAVGSMEENSGASIGGILGKHKHTGSPLEFIERTALDAQISSERIRDVSDKVQNTADYPGSQLGGSLKLVARLIGGGLPTRVFYVSQGGFDTHANQLATHERLLRDLGDSLKGFMADMEAQKNSSRVMVMTFSEFGRRVAENANGGTDHGAAAPMFLAGGKLRAGLLGTYPSLAAEDLFRGDLKFSTDFRSVYATVLERWLKVPAQLVLGRKWPLLDLC